MKMMPGYADFSRAVAEGQMDLFKDRIEAPHQTGMAQGLKKIALGSIAAMKSIGKALTLKSNGKGNAET